jgi:flagellar hook assembly protein FlgD
LYQHMKSEQQGVSIDSSGRWQFGKVNNDVYVGNGLWGYSTFQDISMSVYINGDATMSNNCAGYGGSVVFNVIDPVTFKPWINPGGAYGSYPVVCRPTRKYNFEYTYRDTANRRKAMDFMRDVIPNGAYVIVRNFTAPPAAVFAPQWRADTSLYGSGNSLYHYLKNAGLVAIDSYYNDRSWILIYKKNDNAFTPRSVMGEGLWDAVTLSANTPSSGTMGYITSPVFGPAKSWKQVQWRGTTEDPGPGDDATIDIIGIKYNGAVDTLFYGLTTAQQNFDISSVNAAVYPYIKLRMRNQDTNYHTPYQLKNWRVTLTPIPEGAVAPNIYFTMKDSLELGEALDMKLAFKNIGDAAFDSLKVRMVITDRNNVAHVINLPKLKPLAVGDTVHIRYPIDTKQFQGINTLYVHVNPDNDQPEQHQFNNFIYKTFYVLGDTLNPLLDVTFDNSHILNGDVVSARPAVVIRLQDETKFRLLQDTSLVSIKVRFPGTNTWKTYKYDNDTLKFIPPSGANGNVATVNFNPYLFADGDYEMVVSGKDNSGNEAGGMEYRITFKVINKAMISNMLNYPNPFTTSTAFVFTITGSEVPQNIKIQILTVTGKIVREITKEELGPLRVGKNITEFKWDGTDQYGQKLANGVYLYRVVTNLNGRSLDKYKADDDNSDKYFNKGYGKMYLMR